MTDDAVSSKPTEYGFQFGSALVERCAVVGKSAVVVTVTTPKARLDVYVTKTGKMRLFMGNKEVK